MAIKPKTPRIDLGDTTPTVQLAAATTPVEEKVYYSAYVPRSLFHAIKVASALEGDRKGTDFFQKVMHSYLEKHHPTLLK